MQPHCTNKKSGSNKVRIRAEQFWSKSLVMKCVLLCQHLALKKNLHPGKETTFHPLYSCVEWMKCSMSLSK